MNQDYEEYIRRNITNRYEEINKISNKTYLNVFQNISEIYKVSPIDDVILRASQNLANLETALFSSGSGTNILCNSNQSNY